MNNKADMIIMTLYVDAIYRFQLQLGGRIEQQDLTKGNKEINNFINIVETCTP